MIIENLRFPTLFKLRKTGVVMQSNIEVISAGTMVKTEVNTERVGLRPPITDSSIYEEIRKHCASNPTIIHKAILAANKLWTKKRETQGYRTLKDLDIIVISPTEECISEYYETPEVRNWKERLELLIKTALLEGKKLKK